MTRFLLGGMAVLLLLIAIGRLRRGESPPGTPVISQPGAVGDHPATKSVSPAAVATNDSTAPVPADSPPGPVSRTPTIDLLARLASKRRLAQAAPYTYFDSLMADTDSLLRRWNEERPLYVALRLDPGRPDPQLETLVRRAIAVWEAVALPIRFGMTGDTSTAQMVVRSTERLDHGLVGRTDLTWSQAGDIRSATITLAQRDSTGKPIAPAAALGIAIHEFGHALGLAHSGNPGDVMYPVSGSGRLSARDRATIELLYQLPLGKLREPTIP